MSDVNVDDFKVWVGCLACYNEGNLVGQWYPALEADEVTTKALHAAEGIETDEAGYVKGLETFGPHEELWCFDIEAPYGVADGEMSPEAAAEVARELEACFEELDNCPREAFLKYLVHHSVPVDVVRAREAEDEYLGEYDSFDDYAYERADEQIAAAVSGLSSPLGGLMAESRQAQIDWFASYFDYESFTRDLAMDHFTLRSDRGTEYVFWSV